MALPVNTAAFMGFPSASVWAVSPVLRVYLCVTQWLLVRRYGVRLRMGGAAICYQLQPYVVCLDKPIQEDVNIQRRYPPFILSVLILHLVYKCFLHCKMKPMVKWPVREHADGVLVELVANAETILDPLRPKFCKKEYIMHFICSLS